jgi:hypothetical protein
MKTRCAALLGMFLFLPVTAAQDQGKGADALAKSLKEADVVFTGKVGKVNPLGRTSSIPPSTFGNIAFQDAKALRGTVAEAPTFNYSYKKGTTVNVDLGAKGEVLVAVKGKAVVVLVPATEANLALAKKVIEAREK